MLFGKPAILIEWIHTFDRDSTRGKFFWICQVLLWTNVALYVSAIFTTSFSCVPMEAIFRIWLPGRCIDANAINGVVAVADLVFDVFILVLPQRIIWRLRLSLSGKIGISVIFSMGVL